MAFYLQLPGWVMSWLPAAQAPVQARSCRFYMGEMAMSALALAAAFYGMASVNKWSFSVFLTLQGVSSSPFGAGYPHILL